MLGKLFWLGLENNEGIRARNRREVLDAHFAERERILSARERKVDLGQELRVKERAVECSARVVDFVVAAKAIEAHGFAGQQLLGELHRVDDAAVVGDAALADAPELHIEKARVERCVVDDERRAFDKVEELIRNVCEDRLVGQELVRESVHVDRFLGHFALGIDVELQLIVFARADESSVKGHAADFNESVAFVGREAGRFRVE